MKHKNSIYLEVKKLLRFFNDWEEGKMEDWKLGRLEDWKIGKVEGWEGVR